MKDPVLQQGPVLSGFERTKKVLAKSTGTDIIVFVLSKRIRSGDDGEEVTPVPIPNTEVKLFSADGSRGLPPARVGRRWAQSRLLMEAVFLCCLQIRITKAMADPSLSGPVRHSQDVNRHSRNGPADRPIKTKNQNLRNYHFN